MEVDDTHINLLKDMVLDEGKLVTYLTLAKHLCIHINNSKLLMHSFIKYIREGIPKLELNINFLISGLIDDSKVRVAVCSEDKLEAQKKMFKVVYFLHVYSISKGRPMENSAAIATITKYDDFNLCPGSIKSYASIKRSVEEIANLKSSSRKKTVAQSDLPLKKAKQEDKPLKNVHEVNGKVLKSEPAPDFEIKKETISPKKDFKPSNKPGNQKGIAGFFSKHNGNVKKKDNKIAGDLNTTSQNAVDLNPKTEQDAFVDKMDVDNQEETEEKQEATNEHIKNGNKILNHIKKHSKVDKKRKRVLHVSDSDSEEENDPFVAEENRENTPESDEEIPPTPATNNLKITTGIVNPRKKRKVVDKTYMSDDGYIITKREEVYESYSDSESTDKEVSGKKEIKEKIQISPKTKPKEIKNTPKKKKVSHPQKGKQATLMNFFSKK